MNNSCYKLNIIQRKCQNGISSTLSNCYFSLSENQVITLSFGYTLTITNIEDTYITITLESNEFLEATVFNIPINTTKYFDLPIYNGSFILTINLSKVIL